MDFKKQKALDDFLDEQETEQEKKVIIKERDGLIERLEKNYVTNKGKFLLRG
jgi:hypothetical protein